MDGNVGAVKPKGVITKGAKKNSSKTGGPSIANYSAMALNNI